MKIIDYIQNAKKYILFANSRAVFKRVISSEAEEQVLLIPNSLTIFRKEFMKVFENYYPAELFELSNCFLGSYKEPYMFLRLVKKPPCNIKVSMYDRPAHLYRDDIYDPDCGKLRLSDRYTEDYLEYLSSLDKWRKNDIQPSDVKYERQFRTILQEEFNKEIVYTRFYMKCNDEIRSILKNEKLIILSDIADIIDSHFIGDEEPVEARALDTNKKLRYPYLPEKDSVKYYVTNVQLHKNDIVLYRNQFFLLDKESDFPLYATVGTKVIRTKDGFSTEYLYLYLSSKIAYRIRTVLTIPAGDNIRASSRNIEEFPIVIPKEDDSFYAEKFVKVSVPDERLYEKYNITETPKTVEEILKSECIDTIRSNNEELLRNQIEKDLIELNNCFNAGAYKATLMLAGALLETFLIDWVSELDGIDYFEQDFCVTKSNGKKERADLIDYINRLYNEYTPNWNGMSKKAHIIRKKRNLVHVKLCLKRSDEITKEVCREIVDDLKEIIVSRKIMSK